MFLWMLNQMAGTVYFITTGLDPVVFSVVGSGLMLFRKCSVRNIGKYWRGENIRQRPGREIKRRKQCWYMRSKNCFLDSEYHFLSGMGVGRWHTVFRTANYADLCQNTCQESLVRLLRCLFSPLELKARSAHNPGGRHCCDIWWNFQGATGPKLSPTHCSAIDD